MFNHICMSFEKTTHKRALLYWTIAVSFVLFQFYIQLSSGVVINKLMHERDLTAMQGGILSGAFYYVYTLLQIPVGLLLDRYGVRWLLSGTAALCALGCLLFSIVESLSGLLISRALIGTGAAFAFVGVLHVIRCYFPLRKFAFWTGVSETFAFFITMLGVMFTGTLLELLGLAHFMQCLALIGACIAFGLAYILPNSKMSPHTLIHKTAKAPSLRQSLWILCKNPIAWANGLYVAIGFSVMTVFGGMWAVPFLQYQLHIPLSEASAIDAMLFFGAACSCPLFGFLATRLSQRKPLLIGSYGITACLLICMLLYPIDSSILMKCLFFATGLSCGAYMLSYSIANEVAPPFAASTSSGFTNALAVLSAPVIQGLMGVIIDWQEALKPGPMGLYARNALLLLPLLFLLGAFIARRLPEARETVQQNTVTLSLSS